MDNIINGRREGCLPRAGASTAHGTYVATAPRSAQHLGILWFMIPILMLLQFWYGCSGMDVAVGLAELMVLDISSPRAPLATTRMHSKSSGQGLPTR